MKAVFLILLAIIGVLILIVGGLCLTAFIIQFCLGILGVVLSFKQALAAAVLLSVIGGAFRSTRSK